MRQYLIHYSWWRDTIAVICCDVTELHSGDKVYSGVSEFEIRTLGM